jgi:hypothetical protein
VFQPLAPRYANDPGEANPYGFQRWYRTWAVEFKSTFDVYWVYDGGPVDMKDLPRRAFDSAAQRQETAKIYAQYNEVTQSTPAIDSEFGALAAERVRGSRFRYYVELPVLKELDMWLRPRTELLKMPLDFWNVRAHPWWSVAEFVYAGLDAGYFLLGVVGLCLWQRRGWSGMPALGRGIVAFVVMRCALLLTIDNSEPRYTLECFPVVFLMAGMAVGWWRTKPLVDEADPLRG